MATECPVARVLAAKSYFDVLQLPPPTWDALGRPAWPHADAVGPSFRRLSFALHPDRAAHDDAPRAFQILKRAKAALDDAVEREKYVNRYVEEQRSLPENSAWAGQGSASDRVRAQVARDARVRELRREEARERQSVILEQARQRRLLAEGRASASLARKRRRQAEDERDEASRVAEDERDDRPSGVGAGGPADGGADFRPGSPTEPAGAAVVRPKARTAKPFRRAFI